MQRAGAMSEENDATMESACPACAGPVVVRSNGGATWVYCPSCCRLSRSFLVPGPAGSAVLAHPLAAA
jgi:hypothetical protein